MELVSKMSEKSDWTCHRCVVDSQEAARRHHYHARSSFSLRSASSTTSLRLSTTSTVGLPRRPSSAMGYSVSSSSTDNTQPARLIPCSIPQCEAPSVNIFCAQHLKSFPVPLPDDLVTSASQKPDAAATSLKSSGHPSSLSQSSITSHSVDGQGGAGKPAQTNSEAEVADVARQSAQGCKPNSLETGPVKNRSSPFPTTRSKLLPGNIVRRKTAGKDPYLNRRTPKPGPSTHKDSTSLAKNLTLASTGSSSLKPKTLSSTSADSISPRLTTNISSLSDSNGGPPNKSSSLSPSSTGVDSSRISGSDSGDKPQSETKVQVSTNPANMAIDAPCLAAEKQPPAERQNGSTQSSNPRLPPSRIAELARQLRFSEEMQDVACSGSAVHAPQQPMKGPIPAQDPGPQNNLPPATHQQNSSGGISNVQVIMPTGQSSNYMSMADRLMVHYARSAFDLAGYNPPAGLIRGSMSAHLSANGAELTQSNTTESLPDLRSQVLPQGSTVQSNPNQTVGQHRPLPPQKPRQPQPRPRPIVTNLHEPIIISDSESDSEEQLEPEPQVESGPPPEPASVPEPPQQEPQAKRTELQQSQKSQQEVRSREPVPPDIEPEPILESVSQAQPKPKLIPQPIANPTPQLSPRKQASPPPKKSPTPVPDEPLYAHIDPRIHWPQRHSQEWFEAKQKEIQARGKRKANFGRAAQSMHRQRVAEGPPETLEETLPDKVLDNPAWVDMLKKLRDMKPVTGSGKGKETTGIVTTTATTATATATTTRGRRTGSRLKRTLSSVSTGSATHGGESETADKAITTPNPKRRATGAGLRRTLSNVSAGPPR
ncbi:hypothetical protein NEUTE1DRAFT_127197 [Neurospora tetrasperma FGSC 2508]|uniref:Uncharacterized protein n=1 Tax=Neurospora tetrasperma (strain FGSC 2508 / ATCC MYA-4615 / P0657) TaxID=510951 RepID=F8MBG9_NEUT8|nr:uncharacterized protein NEUTE1DRAFT_127197 [Neurospora tetrasperma FGSC 2508]EGO60281.1 hypothetical protein NEUTE1DRAFT_127197 [Neurospora tetrasperma FGSC 2508]EGZ75755.1 hypothetical protein NEUTE2DRAFT_105913 [Neurospora tetrasperma FGSC 2509]